MVRDINPMEAKIMDKLEEALKNYGINGTIAGISNGPVVQLIEFKPAPGTKIKNITASLDDIARELGTPSLRVESLEENGTIGFEVPQENRQTIHFKDLLNSDEFMHNHAILPIILGTDIRGNTVVADLDKMPHLLVAGTTGSGKSVGLNTFIMSLIAAKKPTDVQFVMIDPKRIEFTIYNNQQYMLFPVITDMSEASAALGYLVEEMERRYGLFEENLVKNISEYNTKTRPLPYIVCIIDEFADLIISDKKIEDYVLRLAQKARAAGIHIILATQRPSVDIVTGIVKANFPYRLAYKTAGAADSRTILDTTGAEKLLGLGDALFLGSDGSVKRIHGAFISDPEIGEMLSPYKSPVKPLPFRKAEVSSPVSQQKMSKSIFKRIWDFWASLRQKDKKLIMNGIVFLFGLFSGKQKKK